MTKTLAFAIRMVELESGRWLRADEFTLEEVKYLKLIYGDNLKKCLEWIYLEHPDKEGLV